MYARWDFAIYGSTRSALFKIPRADWLYESSKMGHYVSYAAMVLAAGSGSGSEHGIFVLRRDEDLVNFCYNEQRQNGESSSRVLRIRHPLQETREAILQTPLAKRGWRCRKQSYPSVYSIMDPNSCIGIVKRTLFFRRKYSPRSPYLENCFRFAFPANVYNCATSSSK